MSRVTKTISGAFNAATSHTVPIPTHSTNELVVVVLGLSTGAVSSTPANFTEEANVGSGKLYMYTHIGQATPITSQVFSCTASTRFTYNVLVIEGAPTTSYVDVKTTATDATGVTAPVMPQITPTTDKCIIISAVGASGANAALPPPGQHSAGSPAFDFYVSSSVWYTYQDAAAQTEATAFSYAGNATFGFQKIVISIKNNDGVVEPRCKGAPADVLQVFGYDCEGMAKTNANLAGTLTTISGITTTDPSIVTAMQEKSATSVLFEGFPNGQAYQSGLGGDGHIQLISSPLVADTDLSAAGTILCVGVYYVGEKLMDTYADYATVFGLYDDTNTNALWWALKGSDSKPNVTTKTKAIIEVAGSLEDDETGTWAADSSATQVSHVIYGRRSTNDSFNYTYLYPVYKLSEMVIVGGSSTRPCSFSTCADLAKTSGLETVQAQQDQALGQFYALQSISIGDGSTPVTWDSTGQSVEFPAAADKTNSRPQALVTEAALSLTINASCTMTANTLNMGDYHNVVFTSGTVTGAALVVNGTLSFSGGAITGWTFSGCKGYSGTISTTLNSCIFDSLAPTSTEYFSVATQAEFNKLSGSTFRNASGAGQVAVEITGNQTGTWTTDPNWTVSGNTYDIRYTGATNFTIESANVLTVTNTGAGVLTIDTPTQALRINPDVNITGSIRYFDGTPDDQTPNGSVTGDFLDYTYTTTDPIDIEVVEQGYVPVNQQNVTPINGTLTIEMDLDEAYNASHSLTIVTHYTFDRATKNFNILADQNAFDVRSSMADTIRTNSSYYNTPLLLEAKPGGKRIDLIDGATITSMATWKGAGMERYDAADAINPVEKWYAIQSVQDITGASVIYRQTNSGDFTIGALTGGKFDETLQFYSDPDHDGTPATENNSALLIKALQLTYREARNDVVAGNGGADLKADLYTIGLAPTAHDYSGTDPGISADLTMTAGPYTVGGKTFAYKWIDAGTNSGTDIADQIHYNRVTNPNGLIPGGTGLRWAEMPDMVIYVTGGVETAQGYREGATPTLVGFYMERGGADHPDLVRAQADDGTYYTPAQSATVTINNITTTSRVQLYDTANSVELYNDIPGSTSYQYSETYSIDRTVRVRITDVVGATAKAMIEATVGSISTSSYDISYTANQVDDDTYNTNAIDGSTVSDITIDDSTNLVNINISAGAVTWPQIYAYQVYWLNTATGIQDDFAFIDAPDTANYILTNFKIKNVTSPPVPLVISSGYGRDSTTGASVDLVDVTGGTLVFAPDHVVAYSSGSGLTAGQDATLTSIKAKTDSLNFTLSGEVDANMKSTNDVEIIGSGTSGDKFRGINA